MFGAVAVMGRIVVGSFLGGSGSGSVSDGGSNGAKVAGLTLNERQGNDWDYRFPKLPAAASRACLACSPRGRSHGGRRGVEEEVVVEGYRQCARVVGERRADGGRIEIARFGRRGGEVRWVPFLPANWRKKKENIWRGKARQ